MDEELGRNLSSGFGLVLFDYFNTMNQGVKKL